MNVYVLNHRKSVDYEGHADNIIAVKDSLEKAEQCVLDLLREIAYKEYKKEEQLGRFWHEQKDFDPVCHKRDELPNGMIRYELVEKYCGDNEYIFIETYELNSQDFSGPLSEYRKG